MARIPESIQNIIEHYVQKIGNQIPIEKQYYLDHMQKKDMTKIVILILLYFLVLCKFGRPRGI